MKTYTEEFKRAAVARLAAEQGVDVAKDLNVNTSMLGKWKKKFAAAAPTAGGRRKFTEEQRRAAVARVHAGESKIDVTKDLQLSSSVLGKWVQLYPEKRPYVRKGIDVTNGGAAGPPTKSVLASLRSILGSSFRLRDVKARLKCTACGSAQIAVDFYPLLPTRPY